MIDREKLVELLYEPFLQYKINELSDTGDIADHLLTNGVVVREKGEWESYWDDAYFQTQVGCITRGTYTLKIVDPLLFVKNFVPSKYS